MMLYSCTHMATVGVKGLMCWCCSVLVFLLQFPRTCANCTLTAEVISCYTWREHQLVNRSDSSDRYSLCQIVITYLQQKVCEIIRSLFRYLGSIQIQIQNKKTSKNNKKKKPTVPDRRTDKTREYEITNGSIQTHYSNTHYINYEHVTKKLWLWLTQADHAY